MDAISNTMPPMNSGLFFSDAPIMTSRSKDPATPYNRAMPMSMMPVEKDPMRKYFRDASLLFKLRLSVPVRIYSGIEMISMPRKSISSVLKDDETAIPHRMKKISAKYSAR